MKYKTLDTKRQFIAGKFIVGIDPGEERYQAAVLNLFGVQLAIFTFQVNYDGYHLKLWKKLATVLSAAEIFSSGALSSHGYRVHRP